LNQKQALVPEPDTSIPQLVQATNTASMRKHDRSLARSVGWNAVSDWVSQIFSWAAFLIVMRLLTPKDFGVAALASLAMPYLAQITGFGIGRAVVMLRELSADQMAQLNTVSFGLGIVCFTFAALLAKPFALFFKTPALAPVMIVASIGLITGGLQVVSGGTLLKQMRFRLFSLLGAATAVIAAIATLSLALLGVGYWALVLGNLFAGLIRTVVLLRIQPCRLAWPRLNSVREPLIFGWHVMVSMLALNSYQRLDNFVAGRVLGQSALGLYGTAWELAYVPIEKVTSLVTTVIPTYLAAVQSEPAALRRYLRGLTEVIALATFPATFGLGLVANELVPLFFGHKWDGMIGPLQVLSFYTAFRSIVALLPKVLTAAGHVRYVMWNDLAALVILPPAFYLGSHYGTTGIAWGWVAAYPFVALPLYHKTFQAIDMRAREYLGAIRPALGGTIAMVVAVELAKHSVFSTRTLLLRLVLDVTVGALVYVGWLWSAHKERMFVLVQMARQLRGTPAPGGASA
jgi:teichuronic acid exporter